jgi:hypothetical protein
MALPELKFVSSSIKMAEDGENPKLREIQEVFL